MNFMGMGSMEIIVIAIVALMIFGPGKLPEMAGQAGKMLRDFKKMTSDLSDEFEKTSGINDIKKQVQKEMAGIQKEVGGVTTGVKKELTSASNSVNKATGKKPATTTAKTLPSGKPAGSVAKTTMTTGSKTATTTAKSTTAKSTTTTKAVAPVKVEPPKATKADPFADVSFMDEAPAVAAPKTVTPVKTAAKPATLEPAAEVDTGDALARARARRQQAGYARVQA